MSRGSIQILRGPIQYLRGAIRKYIRRKTISFHFGGRALSQVAYIGSVHPRLQSTGCATALYSVVWLLPLTWDCVFCQTLCCLVAASLMSCFFGLFGFFIRAEQLVVATTFIRLRAYSMNNNTCVQRDREHELVPRPTVLSFYV